MPSPSSFSFRSRRYADGSAAAQQQQRTRQPHQHGVVLDRQTIRAGRAASAVRLRKQKQEERLALRRNVSKGNANSSASTSAAAIDKPSWEAAVQALVNSNHNNTNKLSSSGEDPLVTLSRAGSAAHSLWQQMIAQDTEKSCQVIEAIVHRLNNNDSAAQSTAAALSLLIVLASPEASPLSSADNYYGAAPLCWGDLFLDASAVLIDLWNRNLQSTTWSALVGMLVAQDATAWTPRVLDLWPRLVQALPQTLHACAALIFYDNTAWGRFFLQHLAPSQLAHMLQLPPATGGDNNNNFDDDTALVETAWMVEGLSRREPAAVQALLQETTLVTNMVSLLLLPTSSSPRVQLPLWRAIGNFAVSNQGQYVTALLESQQPALLQAGVQVLTSGAATTTTVRVEALSTMACLLVDAGSPQHPSTTIALPAWLSHLLQTLVTSTFDVQRQALSTLTLTLGPPPVAASANNNNTDVPPIPWSQEPFTLPTILSQYIIQQGQGAALRQLLQVLLDILHRPDADAHGHALHLLYILFQHAATPARTAWLELDDALHCLEEFLVKSNVSERVADLAARILDDFFASVRHDGDDGDDDDGDQHHEEEAGNTFSFGTPPSQPRSPPAGRGRGRVLPAWMVQRQKTV